jgi:hypothetical protein
MQWIQVKSSLLQGADGKSKVEACQVREGQETYNAVFEARKGDIGPQNAYFRESNA